MFATGTATLSRKVWASSWALVLLLAFTSTVRAVALSRAATERIGRRVWQNECNGSISGLTSWNAGENFASLGIGHFIWYPAGVRGPFEESFPPLLEFVAAHGGTLPAFLATNPRQPCPWSSRSEFDRDTKSERMQELRRFLAATVPLQAEFLVHRLQSALPKMLSEAPAAERERIRQNFERVASTAEGCYALVDYVNFKGEGTLATERYHGEGWGLLQVLTAMRAEVTGRGAVEEFAHAARQVLQRRVENSPPERGERRWLAGWLARVATYPRG